MRKPNTKPRSAQRQAVLDLFDSMESITKFEAAEAIGLSPISAANLLNAMMQDGVIRRGPDHIGKPGNPLRMGLADYVVVMRKPGENADPISGEFKYYVGDNPPTTFGGLTRDDGRMYWTPLHGGTSIDVWQRYASPVWDDINQTDTLNFREGRDNDDERHICPLQLDVIERCIQLWSNPGDVVWTPFMGIGSEVYMAVKLGRRAIGAELKPSYFQLARRNIEQADKNQYEMFAA